MTRFGNACVVMPVALLTVVADVGLEPLVVRASDEPFTPAYLLVVTGVVGLVLVTLPPAGVRRPVGVGLLIGTVVAFLVLLVLIVIELSALGTTGV